MAVTRITRGKLLAGAINANVEAAAGSIGTAELADLGVTTAKMAVDTVQKTAVVTVSSAELLALNATPKTILAAPAAGLAHVPLGMILFLDYNATAYAGIAAGEDLSLKYTDASGAEVLQVEATGFLDATADAIRYAQPSTTLLTPVSAAPLVLHMLVGEIITGDSPLLVQLYYRTIPTVLA